MTPEIKADIINNLIQMTKYGLRCIGVCYKDIQKEEVKFDEENKIMDDPEDYPEYWQGFTWICSTGIKDPVRPEVPGAVKSVQKAGVVVRMVTGDHIETAKFIARECGILTCSDHVAMTGVQFRNLGEKEREIMLPRLRVLARSNPKDKEELVQWYKTKHTVRDLEGGAVTDTKGDVVMRQEDIVAV